MWFCLSTTEKIIGLDQNQEDTQKCFGELNLFELRGPERWLELIRASSLVTSLQHREQYSMFYIIKCIFISSRCMC